MWEKGGRDKGMNVKDVFAEMDKILKEYSATHDFSGTTSHVFFVTPCVHKKMEEYYAMDMHDVRLIKYRGYSLYKWKGMNDEDILFAKVHHAKERSRQKYMKYVDTGLIGPSKACIKRAIDKMFEPNPDFHKFMEELKRRKEVRKEMAIDYKKEWEKLHKECGHLTIIKNGCVTLEYVMDNMIRDTINGREKLMEEYIKEMIRTSIEGGTKHFHLVKVNAHDLLLMDKLHVSKADFAAWLKNRKEVK